MIKFQGLTLKNVLLIKIGFAVLIILFWAPSLKNLGAHSKI